MWEWRIFFPVVEEENGDKSGDTDLKFRTTQRSKGLWSKMRDREERRSDVYYAFDDFSVGVKCRGKKRMEVKLRKRVGRGDRGIEFWEKKRLRSNPDEHTFILQELAKLGCRCAAEGDSSSFRFLCLIVDKARTKTSGHGSAIEFADIFITASSDTKVALPHQRWRSVSMESSDESSLSKSVNDFLRANDDIRKKLGGVTTTATPTERKAVCCGYPEFLFALATSRKDILAILKSSRSNPRCGGARMSAAPPRTP